MIGAAHARSRTSKVNVKSAAESEFVSAAEYLPDTLWVRYFMESQGYKIDKNMLFQDNIFMEINDSRHILSDTFGKRIGLTAGLTHIMLADDFTKLLRTITDIM